MMDKNSFFVGQSYRELALVCQWERRPMMWWSSLLGRDYIDGGKALTCGKGSGGVIYS